MLILVRSINFILVLVVTCELIIGQDDYFNGSFDWHSGCDLAHCCLLRQLK